MSAEGSGGPDLSGVWTGLYTYGGTGEHVSFVATLVESDGALTGDIEEPNTVAAGVDATVHASLQGEVAGSAVSFVKTYDAAEGYEAAVRYQGSVNADRSEIEGRWALGALLTGGFLMVRSPAPAVAAQRHARERA